MNNLITISIVSIVIVSGCTWTKKEITAESLFLISHAIDYKQTKQIPKIDRLRESNFLLGQNPSTNRINNFFIFTGIGHIVFSNYLNASRYSFQKITLGMKLGTIGHNYYLGIKVDL